MRPPGQCLGSTDHTGSDVVVVVAADRAAPAGFHRLSAFAEDRLHHVDAQRGTGGQHPEGAGVAEPTTPPSHPVIDTMQRVPPDGLNEVILEPVQRTQEQGARQCCTGR